MTDHELFVGGVMLVATWLTTTTFINWRTERRFTRSVADARRVVAEMNAAVDEWNAAVERAADDSGEWWREGSA